MDALQETPADIELELTPAEQQAVRDTEIILDENSQEFVDKLVDVLMKTCDDISELPFRPYQLPPARRIFESIIIGDGARLTLLCSRQCLDGDTVVFRRNGTAVRLREHEDAWSTGVKPTKRYVAHGGGEIVATDNHPVMTPEGWKPAGELKPGDLVSVMTGWKRRRVVRDTVERTITTKNNRGKLDRAVARKITVEDGMLLGYFITDGSNRPGQSLKFTNIKKQYLAEFADLLASRFGMEVKWYSKGSGYDLLITGSKSGLDNPFRDFIRALDWDHGFPLNAFRWSTPVLSAFINRAWAGDGTVTTKRGHPDVFLACGNDEIYARYWQALLLSQGIQTTVKREIMEKGTGVFHRLTLGAGSIRRFFHLAGEIYGKEEGSRAALSACAPQEPEAPVTWPCPGYSKHLYRSAYGQPRMAECSRCGSPNTMIPSGIGKGLGAKTSGCMPHKGLDGEQLTFKRIMRIEDAGEREVFDVSYPGKGWFVAQGVQVHKAGKARW